jgi:hypothetical protein
MTIGGVDYSTQITDWTMDPGVQDGAQVFTFSSAGEGHNSIIEDTDGKPVLSLTWLSNWTSGGFDDYLWLNNNTTANFVLDHHPDIVGEHVQWTGQLKIVATPVGGKARDTETTTQKFQCFNAIQTYGRVS